MCVRLCQSAHDLLSGTALPVNGGAYNALLNTTTKGIAALAACLTLLSYVATAVVSGTEACAYVKSLWEVCCSSWVSLVRLVTGLLARR